MSKEVKAGLVWGGSIFVLAIGAVLARKLGYMESDTVTRLVIGANGLMIAWYGNRIPKAFVRSAQARSAQRVSGWCQVLSGLTYTGLWAFAPISVAGWGSLAVVVTGIAVTFGYCLSLESRAKAT